MITELTRVVGHIIRRDSADALQRQHTEASSALEGPRLDFEMDHGDWDAGDEARRLQDVRNALGRRLRDIGIEVGPEVPQELVDRPDPTVQG